MDIELTQSGIIKLVAFGGVVVAVVLGLVATAVKDKLKIRKMRAKRASGDLDGAISDYKAFLATVSAAELPSELVHELIGMYKKKDVDARELATLTAVAKDLVQLYTARMQGKMPQGERETNKQIEALELERATLLAKFPG